MVAAEARALGAGEELGDEEALGAGEAFGAEEALYDEEALGGGYALAALASTFWLAFVVSVAWEQS